MLGITNQEWYYGIPILSNHSFASDLCNLISCCGKNDHLHHEYDAYEALLKSFQKSQENILGTKSVISTITIDGKDEACKCIDVASLIRNTLDYGLMVCPRSHLPFWRVLSMLESVCMSNTVIIMQMTHCHFAVCCKTYRKKLGIKTMKAFLMHSNLNQLLQHHIAFGEMIQLLTGVFYVGVTSKFEMCCAC